MLRSWMSALHIEKYMVNSSASNFQVNLHSIKFDMISFTWHIWFEGDNFETNLKETLSFLTFPLIEFDGFKSSTSSTYCSKNLILVHDLRKVESDGWYFSTNDDRKNRLVVEETNALLTLLF